MAEQERSPAPIPAGFRAAGAHCGVKKAKKDLSLIVSDLPAVAAGVFTQNRICAAPVVVTKERVERSAGVRAIVTNSGNANACTGERGMNDARAMAAAVAKHAGCDAREVLVSSTGVIGQFLPVEKIVAAAPALCAQLSPEGFAAAAEAIMTTDTFAKSCAERFDLGGRAVTIYGMAKGSGMIAPNMATMLCYLCTDARIEKSALQSALAAANERTFNSITVDGDTSTNDMALVLANGAAGGGVVRAGSNEFDAFSAHLESVCRALAQLIVRDGEGASKFIEILVRGAASERDARAAARAIANSNLVKTAMHGEDANWGRIAAAAGYSGAAFDPAAMEIWIGGVQTLKKNYVVDFSEAEAKQILSRRDIAITINLNAGAAAATFWTCDLTKEYVHINASYRN